MVALEIKQAACDALYRSQTSTIPLTGLEEYWRAKFIIRGTEDLIQWDFTEDTLVVIPKVHLVPSDRFAGEVIRRLE